MAHHVVDFFVPDRPLERADIVFKVRSDDELLGTLAVSKGGVVWWPNNTTYGYKMNWEKLNTFFKGNATQIEKR